MIRVSRFSVWILGLAKNFPELCQPPLENLHLVNYFLLYGPISLLYLGTLGYFPAVGTLGREIVFLLYGKHVSVLGGSVYKSSGWSFLTLPILQVKYIGQARYDGPVQNIVVALREYFGGESLLRGRVSVLAVLGKELNMIDPKHFSFVENCDASSSDMGSVSMMVEPEEIWKELMKSPAFASNWGGKVVPSLPLMPVYRGTSLITNLPPYHDSTIVLLSGPYLVL